MSFPLKSHTKPSAFGHVIGLALVVLFSVLAIWLVANRQYVIDQIAVWQYHPSAAVAALAARTDMTKQARFDFYASQPAIESAADFNKSCASVEQSTAILGCYSADRIYIYNVTDTRLDGIKETTAAHEMLHAAYARLTSSERQHVNALVEAEYQKLKNDKDFSQRMAFYARTEPGERDNELHSIIGTEVPTISPELEAYYKQYFTNRQAVVGLHEAYNSLFTELSAKKATLEAQLTALSSKIDSESSQYNADVAQLNTDIETFNDKAQHNGFQSQSEFSNERASLVNRIAALSNERAAISNDVSTYQDLYEQYQAVAGQSDTLNRSIDSKLVPAPAL